MTTHILVAGLVLAAYVAIFAVLAINPREGE